MPVDAHNDPVAVVRWIDNRATDEFVRRLLAAVAQVGMREAPLLCARGGAGRQAAVRLIMRQKPGSI